MIIKNGTVYDPLNNIDGEKMDIFTRGKKISDKGTGDVIDASGLVVFPGGVDIHSHIAGSKVNLGRLLCPEDHRIDPVSKTPVTRSGTGHTVPTTFITGYRYAGLGYTTVMEAAVPPLEARHAHEELLDTPIIDKGTYTLMGNNYFILKYVKSGEFDKLKNYIAFLLKATRGFAVKMVNPGGVENWKWGKNVDSLDDSVERFGVTPREIIMKVAKANDELELPHSIHLHCNNLGYPGNYQTTLDTMAAVKKRLHVTHIQFNSYAGEDWASFESGANEVANRINQSDNVTCDVGQIVFGKSTIMTSDAPRQFELHKLTGNKWSSSDIEMETSAGVLPYNYREKNPVNAIQWAIGLELFLLIKDPWRVHLTTDHPNGGPFYKYPQIISWLMSKNAREEMLEKVNPAASSKTTLPSLDREYSLYEIATVTRAATAKALGLKNKGHLGVGADADVTIYQYDSDDIEGSFARPKYVIKSGKLVAREGVIVESSFGKTHWVDAGGDATDEIRKAFSKYYTVNFENYPVQEEYTPKQEVLKCG